MPSLESEAARIFLEAVEEHEPLQREGFARNASGGDAELLNRVRVLLKAHDESNPMLRPGPSIATLDFLESPERPGTVIGPYRLLEQIGEGGMGLVFVAEQKTPVRRKVALKVIKPGMDSQAVIARFKAEQQALALMDHPNIAKVLDAGMTESGRPYFVMELVRGIPITEFCDQARMTIRQRLELFILVCRAVQHAHTKGVIHRDLKPSNILVTSNDGVPVPMVIDFGVAKAIGQQLTEQTVHTGFAQMIGTPLYMSPEQAEFNQQGVDTRSDIYSLGVLLHELLTGTTPIDIERLRTLGHDELRRILRDEEPTPPSARLSTLGNSLATASQRRGVDARKLGQILHGELDWIVLKSLEKDRARRYETASAFAADVQRYLTDEPVEACPPSRWYRARKFARRNRGPVVATGLIVLALVGGTVGAAYGLIVAREAEADAKAGQEKAEKAERASKAFSDFLVNHFLAPEPDKGAQAAMFRENFNMADVEDQLLVRPGVDMKMSEALALAEQRMPVLDPPGLRHAIGLAWLKLGRPSEAARNLRVAFEQRERELGPDHEDTVTCGKTLGRVLVAAGRPDEAIPVLEKVRAIRESKHGLEFRAANGYHPAQGLVALYDLAKAYRAAGRLPEATRLLELLNDRQLDNTRADRLEWMRQGSMAYSSSVVRDLAAAYRDAGRGDEATRLWVDTVSTLGTRLGPSHAFTQEVRLDWTRTLHDEGKFDSAVEINSEAVAAIRRDGREDPHALRVTLWHLGHSLLAAGRPADAECALQESLTLWKRYAPDRWPKFDVQRLLGEALLRQQRYAEAEPLLLAGYAGLAERVGKDLGVELVYLAAAADRLAEVYTALGKPTEVAKWRAERAKYPREKAPPPRRLGL